MEENNNSTNTAVSQPTPQPEQKMKFCKHCGGKIPEDAVLCTLCGRQVEDISKNNAAQPQIIINNDNINTNTNTNVNNNGGRGGKAKNKWVALVLCFFLGVVGGHKFYEGKIGMGILYLFTAGLFGIGALIDFIVLLFKPNPYYV
ncbi:TM2 domain-containing protein [Ruminococcus sp.]|uniref:TM2 domain-containing protein n=1 Tax=Ruminococcus sp. TaxID=41978 RepID=UPI0025DE1699|nr:TM2 domain-containing protein [Ruminococcus sp.]